MRSRRNLWTVVLLSSVVVPALGAQQRLAPVIVSATAEDFSPTTGVVHGVVRGENGRGIPNVMVRLGDRELRTADNGVFVFPHVMPGEYTLQARAAGMFGYFVWLGVSEGPSDPLVIEAQPAPEVPAVPRLAGDDRARFFANTPRFWDPVTFYAAELQRVRASSVTAWLDDRGLVEPGGLTSNPVRVLDTTWANIGHVVSGGAEPSGWTSTLVSNRTPRPPLPAFAPGSGQAKAAWGLRARSGGLFLGSSRIANPNGEIPTTRGPDPAEPLPPQSPHVMPIGDGLYFDKSWCSGIQTFLNGRPTAVWVLDAAAPSDFDIIDVSQQNRPDGPCTIVALWTRPGATAPPVRR